MGGTSDARGSRISVRTRFGTLTRQLVVRVPIEG